MKVKLTSLLFVLSQIGCSQFPFDDDRAAVEYKATADVVLQALNRYLSEQGRAPNSLRELRPEYLKKMPETLEVRYNAFTTTLYFDYATEWHRQGRVICSAKAGDRDWFCERAR